MTDVAQCRIMGKDDSDGIAHLDFIPDKTNSSDVFKVHEGEGDKQVRFPFCHRVSQEQVLFIPVTIANGLEIADTRSRGDSKNLHVRQERGRGSDEIVV